MTALLSITTKLQMEIPSFHHLQVVQVLSGRQLLSAIHSVLTLTTHNKDPVLT